jgi:endonuclease/exonuclease/phosphatase family metal-dependent hydrolase
VNVLRVMSFNIRHDNPDDGEDGWPYRKERAASVVRLHRPDVVGLQEALAGQIEDLARRLPGFAWVGVGRDDGMTRGEYAPLFYRTARLSLLATSTFWLSKTPEVPGSLDWGACCTRIATWAKFLDRATDRVGFVINVHLDHDSAEARRKAARLLLDRSADLVGAAPSTLRAASLVVLGDLNCTEASAPYRILTQAGLADAKARSEAPHHGPEGTFHAFTGEPRARIDYIFVSPNLRGVQHAVLPDHWDGRYPSDHFPVVADVVAAG